MQNNLLFNPAICFGQNLQLNRDFLTIIRKPVNEYSTNRIKLNKNKTYRKQKNVKIKHNLQKNKNG